MELTSGGRGRVAKLKWALKECLLVATEVIDLVDSLDGPSVLNERY